MEKNNNTFFNSIFTNFFSFRFLVISIFLVFLLGLSACSSEVPDCSEQDTTYVKFSWDEESETCILIKSIPKNKCGNEIKEGDETFCNCPQDVKENAALLKGGCSGSNGDYLNYYCSDNEKCELKVSDKVKNTKKLLNFRSGGDLSMKAQVSYFIPFMLDRHNVNIDFRLIDFLDETNIKVKDITIRQVYIVTQSKELLGVITKNSAYKEKQEVISVQIPLDKFTLDTFDKEAKGVSIKILLSYNKYTYDKNGIIIKSSSEEVELQESFEGRLTLIDPNNKDEVLDDDGSSAWDI